MSDGPVIPRSNLVSRLTLSNDAGNMQDNFEIASIHIVGELGEYRTSDSRSTADVTQQKAKMRAIGEEVNS